MEKTFKRMMVFFAIFSFLILPFLSTESEGTISNHDYSDLMNKDFTMGNSYNDNVTFESVSFNPNQTFISEIRSDSDNDNYYMTTRQLRVNNTWFNYRVRNNKIIFYETLEFFAHIDDGDEEYREYELEQNLLTSNWFYPITFYNNGTYYLYVSSEFTNETVVFYGNNPTNLSNNQTVYEHNEEEDYFGEIYRWNETCYFTMVMEYNAVTSWWQNMTLFISDDLLNWTQTGKKIEKIETDFYEYSAYMYNNSWYIYTLEYSDVTEHMEHIYYKVPNIFDVNNYTIFYNETNDDIFGIKYYPIGHSFVKYYFNNTDNKLYAGIVREKYEIYNGSIYKFYYNGVYETNNIITNATEINDYFLIYGWTGFTYRTTTFHIDNYGFNFIAFGELAFVNFTKFDLTHPEFLSMSIYIPNTIKDNIGLKIYINTTQNELLFSNFYIIEILGNKYADYYSFGELTIGDIKYRCINSFYFNDDKKENIQLNIMNDPSEIDIPLWYAALQVAVRPEVVIGWLSTVIGGVMLFTPSLPTRAGAVLLTIGSVTLLGLGTVGFLSVLI